MEAKKKRGCNFTASEKELLLDLIKKHEHIIENKDTKGHVILKKREAWEFVCQRYNAVAVSGFRNCHQLRHLYENIKQRSTKNNPKINKKRYTENTIELQKKASNEKKEICHNGDGAYESTCTNQDAQFLVMVTPKIEPLLNPYDDASSYFGDVEVNKNNNDEASELINTDKTDNLYTTIPDVPVTKHSNPSTVTFNTPDERESTMATVHQECHMPLSSTSESSHEISAQTPRKRKPKENNVKLEYFKAKLRNAKYENNYLINKIKMDREKHKIEMEILQIKLNQLKCVRRKRKL